MENKQTFGFWGHAYRRKFLYVEKSGEIKEIITAGGAALVQKILSGKDLADVKPSLGDDYRCELYGLQQYEETKPPKSYYAIGQHTGFHAGKTAYSDTKNTTKTIVLDEGFGFDKEQRPPKSPALWASNKSMPPKDIYPATDVRLLLLDAEVLRKKGAMISKRVSWERTATDLVWQLHNNAELTYLLQTPHIIITFGEDGAVAVRTENRKIVSATLTLEHGRGENTLRDKLKGRIDDTFAVMVAAAALQFDALTAIDVSAILKSAATLLDNGYDIAKLQTGDYEIATETAGDIRKTGASFAVPITADKNKIENDYWCITSSLRDTLFLTACNYVLNGAKEIAGLPQLSFGNLTTIDRKEIEAFQNISNLIVNYSKSDSLKPLSIAVFGSPGSGKSFGVTEIANHIMPKKVERMEFNVSQFTGVEDLGSALQQVRDVTLKGKLPLVFFDEFDSDELKWLKSFLMPMQDGKFRDSDGEHPLGKCIFVFAGGTSSSFEEFTKPMSAEAGDSEALKDLKARKAPDFVSRLRGTINILGPNRIDENDRNYILRRALLLRSLCERKLKMKRGGEAPINQAVMRAMLLVPKYKHGARSMEAIFDMSNLEGAKWEPSSLPFLSQLSLHVDAEKFINLVLRREILNSYLEDLSSAIHDFYRKRYPNTDYGNVEWEDLPETIKDSNRKQALMFEDYLNAVGCSYDAHGTHLSSVKKLTGDEIEQIAIRAHEIWMDGKLKAGYKYGTDKDEKRKINPCLVSWEKLPDKERKKDRDIAENIIPLLESAGMMTFRVE